MPRHFDEFIEELKRQKRDYLKSITEADYRSFVRAELNEFLNWLQKRYQKQKPLTVRIRKG